MPGADLQSLPVIAETIQASTDKANEAYSRLVVDYPKWGFMQCFFLLVYWISYIIYDIRLYIIYYIFFYGRGLNKQIERY